MSRRQTVGFFLHPNYDARVACLPTCTDADHPPRYAPILAGEHMFAKLERLIAWGPRNGPQTPTRSGRRGEAVAPLDSPRDF